MRVILTIALLFCFALARAQNQNLRELLGMRELSCSYVDSLVQHKIIALKADERQDSIPKLLSYWQANCEPSEAMVRIQILNDIENGYPLADLETLQPFLSRYYLNLSYQEKTNPYSGYPLDSTLLNYTQAWADSLLNTESNKTTAEQFVLQILAQASATEAKHLAYSKPYYDLEGNEELRKRIKHPDGFYIDWELGLLSYHYQRELARYLDISPALHLAIGSGSEQKTGVFIYGQFAASNFKNDFRIIGADSAAFTQGKYSISTGLQLNYRLIETHPFRLKSIVNVGYTFLDSGLEEERVNSEGETYNKDLGMNSYDLGLGLQADFRLYHYRHLGLRATYHFTDFNLGTRALNDLSGGHFAIGLIFY